MLKLVYHFSNCQNYFQPPLGGCVLKPLANNARRPDVGQPPLGGCVLKLDHLYTEESDGTAASRRLCVETMPLRYDANAPDSRL